MSFLVELALILTPVGHATSPPEEVVVEAPAPDDVPRASAVTIVPIDERQAAIDDVARAAARAPGTHAVRLGGLGDFAAVSIRGSGLQHVTVALDGIPLNPDGAATVNLSEWPVSALSRIEVWRGAAPPELALAPAGGVLRLVTRDTPATEVSLAGASFGTVRAHALHADRVKLGAGTLDGLALASVFSTAGTYRYFDDNATIYNRTDDRIRERVNNDKTQMSALARGRWRAPRYELTVLDAWLSRSEGLPGRAGAPSLDAQLSTQRNLLAASLAGRRRAMSGSAHLYGLWRGETLQDERGTIGVGTQHLSTRQQHRGLRLHGRIAPTPQVAPWTAISLRHDGIRLVDHLANTEADPGERLAVRAAVGAELWPLRDRLQLELVAMGLLLDDRGLGGEPFVDGATAAEHRSLRASFTPRLGLLVLPHPAVALFANGARVIRPPSLTEMFGDRGGQVGNSDLRDEAGWSADVGIRAQAEHPWLSGRGELAVFGSWLDDRIVWIQNAQRTAVAVNVGRSRVLGMELAGSGDIANVVDLQASLTLMQPVNLTDDDAVRGKPLPQVPTWEAHTELGLHWQDRLRAGWGFSFTDGSAWDTTGVFLAAPRAFHRLFLRARPGPGWPSLELAVLNVADRLAEVVPLDPFDADDPGRRVAPVSSLAGYPLPGRTVQITLRWSPS